MLELADKLAVYGIDIEDVAKIEGQYQEYMKMFTENELYRKAVGELTQEIFERFASGSEDEAKRAHYEIQALRNIVEKLRSFETEYLKIQAIKETNVGADVY